MGYECGSSENVSATEVVSWCDTVPPWQILHAMSRWVRVLEGGPLLWDSTAWGGTCPQRTLLLGMYVLTYLLTYLCVYPSALTGCAFGFLLHPSSLLPASFLSARPRPLLRQVSAQPNPDEKVQRVWGSAQHFTSSWQLGANNFSQVCLMQQSCARICVSWPPPATTPPSPRPHGGTLREIKAFLEVITF